MAFPRHELISEDKTKELIAALKANPQYPRNECNDEGYTLLQLAARENRVEAVLWLLYAGEDIDFVHSEGVSDQANSGWECGDSSDDCRASSGRGASKACGQEPKGNNMECGDRKACDQKYGDQHYDDQKYSDQKYSDQRSMDLTSGHQNDRVQGTISQSLNFSTKTPLQIALKLKHTEIAEILIACGAKSDEELPQELQNSTKYQAIIDGIVVWQIQSRNRNSDFKPLNLLKKIRFEQDAVSYNRNLEAKKASIEVNSPDANNLNQAQQTSSIQPEVKINIAVSTSDIQPSSEHALLAHISLAAQSRCYDFFDCDLINSSRVTFLPNKLTPAYWVAIDTNKDINERRPLWQQLCSGAKPGEIDPDKEGITLRQLQLYNLNIFELFIEQADLKSQDKALNLDYTKILSKKPDKLSDNYQFELYQVADRALEKGLEVQIRNHLKRLTEEASQTTSGEVRRETAIDSKVVNQDSKAVNQDSKEIPQTDSFYWPVVKFAFEQRNFVALSQLINNIHLIPGNDVKTLIKNLVIDGQYDLVKFLLIIHDLDTYQLALEWRGSPELVKQLITHCSSMESLLHRIMSRGILTLISPENQYLFEMLKTHFQKETIEAIFFRCIHLRYPDLIAYDPRQQRFIISDRLTEQNYLLLSTLRERFSLNFEIPNVRAYGLVEKCLYPPLWEIVFSYLEKEDHDKIEKWNQFFHDRTQCTVSGASWRDATYIHDLEKKRDALNEYLRRIEIALKKTSWWRNRFDRSDIVSLLFFGGFDAAVGIMIYYTIKYHSLFVNADDAFFTTINDHTKHTCDQDLSDYYCTETYGSPVIELCKTLCHDRQQYNFNWIVLTVFSALFGIPASMSLCCLLPFMSSIISRGDERFTPNSFLSQLSDILENLQKFYPEQFSDQFKQRSIPQGLAEVKTLLETVTTEFTRLQEIQSEKNKDKTTYFVEPASVDVRNQANDSKYPQSTADMNQQTNDAKDPQFEFRNYLRLFGNDHPNREQLVPLLGVVADPDQGDSKSCDKKEEGRKLQLG